MCVCVCNLPQKKKIAMYSYILKNLIMNKIHLELLINDFLRLKIPTGKSIRET